MLVIDNIYVDMFTTYMIYDRYAYICLHIFKI